jgi:TolB protein
MSGQTRLVVGAVVGLMLAQVVAVGVAVTAAQHLPGSVIACNAVQRTTQDILIRDVSRNIAANLTGRQLSSHHEREPAWSPDGSQVAFTMTEMSGGPGSLWVNNMDGSGLRQLTRAAENDLAPEWSPDGEHIAFMSYQGGYADIYVMDSAGGGIQALTNTPLIHEAWPTWSPDGQQIAYSVPIDREFWGIYVTDANGGNQRQIVSGEYYAAVWSPRGAQIAYKSGQDRTRLLIIDVDSGSIQRLTAPSSVLELAWLPDGQHLAFTIDSCFCADVYVMNVASGEQYRIPYAGFGGNIPAWRPG